LPLKGSRKLTSLIHTTLIGADLSDANLVRAYLKGANLSGANLSAVSLGDAYLTLLLQSLPTEGETKREAGTSSIPRTCFLPSVRSYGPRPNGTRFSLGGRPYLDRSGAYGIP
jgi:pentapeptide repeat protein